MSTFGNFTYTKDEPLYAGAPIQETKDTLAALDKANKENFAYNNQIEVAARNLQVAPENEGIKDEALKVLDAAAPFKKRGDWENAFQMNTHIANSIATNKDLNKAILFKQREEEAKKLAQELQAKTQKTSLIFGLDKSQAVRNPDGTENDYRPEVISRPDYSESINKLWDKAKADGVFGLKANDDLGAILSGKVVSFSPEKVNKLYKYIITEFENSDEGKIYKREHKELNKLNDVQYLQQITKDTLESGLARTFVDDETKYDVNQIAMRIALQNAENAAKAAAAEKEKKEKFQTVNSTEEIYVRGGSFNNSKELLLRKNDLNKAIDFAKSDFNSKIRELSGTYKMPSSVTLDSFDDEGNFIDDRSKLIGYVTKSDGTKQAVDFYDDVKTKYEAYRRTKDIAEKHNALINNYLDRVNEQNKKLGIPSISIEDIDRYKDIRAKIEKETNKPFHWTDIFNLYKDENIISPESQKFLAEREKQLNTLDKIVADDNVGWYENATVNKFTNENVIKPYVDYIQSNFFGSKDGSSKQSTAISRPRFAAKEGEDKRGELDKSTYDKYFTGGTKPVFLGYRVDPDSKNGFVLDFKVTGKDISDSDRFEVDAPANIVELLTTAGKINTMRVPYVTENPDGTKTTSLVTVDDGLLRSMKNIYDNEGVRSSFKPSNNMDLGVDLEILSRKDFNGDQPNELKQYVMYFPTQDQNGKRVTQKVAFDTYDQVEGAWKVYAGLVYRAKAKSNQQVPTVDYKLNEDNLKLDESSDLGK